MSSPQIHICVRQTLDWRDAALVNARIIPAFRAKFETWNATFTTPYHAFRQRLTEIARLNLDRVEGTVCSSLADVPPGDVVVPVDDDDWFAPDLGVRLRGAHDGRAHGYLWRRHVVERPRLIRDRLRGIARALGRRGRYTCKTNNYAVVNIPGCAELALSHVRASAYFDAHPSAITDIPVTLAVQNRNLASQTTLAWGQPTIQRDALVALLDQHQRLYSSWEPPASVRWAKPYVALMAELLSDVHVR